MEPTERTAREVDGASQDPPAPRDRGAQRGYRGCRGSRGTREIRALRVRCLGCRCLNVDVVRPVVKALLVECLFILHVVRSQLL